MSDLIAGVTVGLVALPLAMAFAISSGMPPQAGLYCAVVTGFLISALGGSMVQIGGPTGAFVVVVSGIVAQYGLDGLFMCTMMAGVLLVVMGLTGTGTAVRFIPRPVVIGFTNGIALVIASTQIKDFFGIPLPERAGRVRPEDGQAGRERRCEFSLETTVVGIGVLALILLWNRLVPRVPGYIVALLAGTVAVALAASAGRDHRHAVRRHSLGLPAVPRPAVPSRSDPHAALADADGRHARRHRVADVRGGRRPDDRRRHNSNVELVAQGIANIASPLVGGLPATGAIARTATNIRSGARRRWPG